MSIHITFACGTEKAYPESIQTDPVCTHCGTREIAVVRPSRPPRFTGTCTGPHAEYQHLDGAVVNVAPAGPLLKEAPNGTTH